MRSDREHCASRVAVEQEEEERRGGEEQATDIKSNNPHLAGGEKRYAVRRLAFVFSGPHCFGFDLFCLLSSPEANTMDRPLRLPRRPPEGPLGPLGPLGPVAPWLCHSTSVAAEVKRDETGKSTATERTEFQTDSQHVRAH